MNTLAQPVLEVLLEPHPGLVAVDEIMRDVAPDAADFADRDDVLIAIRELTQVGLADELYGLTFASIAAVAFDGLHPPKATPFAVDSDGNAALEPRNHDLQTVTRAVVMATKLLESAELRPFAILTRFRATCVEGAVNGLRADVCGPNRVAVAECEPLARSIPHRWAATGA